MAEYGITITVASICIIMTVFMVFQTSGSSVQEQEKGIKHATMLNFAAPLEESLAESITDYSTSSPRVRELLLLPRKTTSFKLKNAEKATLTSVGLSSLFDNPYEKGRSRE